MDMVVARIPPPYPFPPLPPDAAGVCPPGSADCAIARDRRAGHGQGPVVENTAALAVSAIAGRTTALRAVAAVSAERHVAADRAVGQRHRRTA